MQGAVQGAGELGAGGSSSSSSAGGGGGGGPAPVSQAPQALPVTEQPLPAAPTGAELLVHTLWSMATLAPTTLPPTPRWLAAWLAGPYGLAAAMQLAAHSAAAGAGELAAEGRPLGSWGSGEWEADPRLGVYGQPPALTPVQVGLGVEGGEA